MALLGILLALVLGVVMIYGGYYCFVGGIMVIIATVSTILGGKKKGD